MNKNYKQVPVDLSEFQIKDESLKEITNQVQLVSSTQLAKIFSKKNDNSFRAARSKGHGFKYYKDLNGNVFYNLPEILKQMRIKL
jgi:hypothetical protein|tara:strand:- start:684 stop:938 length:255 start_codon:yes stop_codon:yes gene_type:complete